MQDKQGNFRECLSRCGLHDLGFVGQRYTWCNGRFGEQRTKLRLDRMVASESWSEKFPEARVHHFATSISDHCLLTLFLYRRQPHKPVRKRFFFEAMWTREGGCREVIEEAQDPMWRDLEFRLTDRLKSCKEHLQRWNWRVFGNVNKILRQKQNRLQQLESIDGVLDKAKEIQSLKREINETLTREEIMWKQRSRVLWLKWGDRNMKFFHATASQRRGKNKIWGLQNQQGEWIEDQEGIESIILEYFVAIFKSKNPSSFDASLNETSTRVAIDMNEELLAVF